MKRISLIGILFGFIASNISAGQNPYGLLELEGYGNSDTTGITSKRGRNDFTIKESLASGDNLFFMKAYGYNGTAFPSGAAASVEYQASEAWSATANGTNIVFKTTPKTTATAAASLTVSSTGLGLLANAAPRTNLTPLAAGTIVWNSADAQLCVSTGTTATTWVQVADGTTACSH